MATVAKRLIGSQSADSFDQMGLKKQLLRGIREFGLEKPNATQLEAIPPCIAGKDVIVQAKIGSGKTTALCISVLQRVDEKKPNVQALVMVPSRELAKKLLEKMELFGKYMSVKFHMCIGGTSVRDDQRKLEGGVQVIVGTQGRVNHMILIGALKLDSVKLFVLDEADRMSAHESKEDFDQQLKRLPADGPLLPPQLPPPSTPGLPPLPRPGFLDKFVCRLMQQPIPDVEEDVKNMEEGTSGCCAKLIGVPKAVNECGQRRSGLILLIVLSIGLFQLCVWAYFFFT